ncbi:hypothetical protein E2C01_094518 [Portunus trituberculatus]|uniref:Uncharacterized protein n=1 Tax=Portunus trituberculatus TaxID=210409 RepID=A0A5B7JSL5_PORTR|nr:hypothetical protein [Portunus trituberculatus]
MTRRDLQHSNPHVTQPGMTLIHSRSNLTPSDLPQFYLTYLQRNLIPSDLPHLNLSWLAPVKGPDLVPPTWFSELPFSYRHLQLYTSACPSVCLS